MYMSYPLFSCLALIEEETSRLYEEIVKKAESPQVEVLLFNILQGTVKHREVLKHIAKAKGQTYPPPVGDCEEKMGKFFKESMEFTRIMADDLRKGMPVINVLKKLAGFEEGIGEEYLTQIHSRIGTRIESDPAVKRVLEEISTDENRHMKDLKKAIEMITRKKD